MPKTAPKNPFAVKHAGNSRLELAAHQVVLRPLVTEKGMHHSSTHQAYAFEVNALANKEAIRKAVEELFDVKVIQVRTQNRRGKPRRTRFRFGYTQNWKRAIVKLHPESKQIDFF
ncbi:MAG: 50S ribosomal protein L23 [Planctomycetota bacterium]|nr:MAG: 50S ribosomal protein L23 [Planctomycetota bacterium]REJ97177.1 MAG: 50S ribosomal protein L23 [Planctomycetota bacterium]REK27986.1 MAG: 50S ribosomal protein L23 [Planctomycetota bacterium]REK48697.1 MAG: 50S ribosomal protein L23 [Planctomycetota bacterium]